MCYDECKTKTEQGVVVVHMLVWKYLVCLRWADCSVLGMGRKIRNPHLLSLWCIDERVDWPTSGDIITEPVFGTL